MRTSIMKEHLGKKKEKPQNTPSKVGGTNLEGKCKNQIRIKIKKKMNAINNHDEKQEIQT